MLAVGIRGVVAEDLGTEDHLTLRCPGVGIEEQLRGVGAEAPARVERTMGPEAVALTGPHPGNEDVPHAGVDHRDLAFGPVLVEQAQRHAVCHGGGHGEVGAGHPVGPVAHGCTERVGPPRWNRLVGTRAQRSHSEREASCRSGRPVPPRPGATLGRAGVLPETAGTQEEHAGDRRGLGVAPCVRKKLCGR